MEWQKKINIFLVSPNKAHTQMSPVVPFGALLPVLCSSVRFFEADTNEDPRIAFGGHALQPLLT